MTNLKKMMLASAILTTGSITAQAGMDIETRTEIDGVINIYGATQINFAEDSTIENYGKINFFRTTDGDEKIALNGGDENSGINVHLGKEFRPMSGLVPTALLMAKDDPMLKDYFSTLVQKSYCAMMTEGGSINVKTGEAEPESLTTTDTLTTYFTDNVSVEAPRVRFVEEEQGLFDFLNQEGNNINNNVMVLRGDADEINLDNSTGNYSTNPFVVETALANSSSYMTAFSSMESDQGKTLSNTQNLKVKGYFDFKAGNEFFTDGKVSFDAGEYKILSVTSMFLSDIDVGNSAKLILDPQCRYYNGGTKLEENNTTITYNKTMNVKGNLTVRGGKLIIGTGAVLNFSSN